MPAVSAITRRAALALAGIGLTARAALAQSSLDRIRAAGVIRAGFANEAPFGFVTPDGQLTGEAPEVARAVLARMGIPRVEGVLTEFGSLIPGLQAGRFDLIAAGMFITPRRCTQIAFSEPSFGVGQALLVRAGNPLGLRDYGSVAANPAVRLAVMAGAAERDYARAAGVSDSQLLTLPDQSSLLAAVQAGRAEAAGLSALSTADMARKGHGVEALPPFGEVAGRSVTGHGGFGFRTEDRELRERFDTELRAFLGTPAHQALVAPFGFGPDQLPRATTAALCTGR